MNGTALENTEQLLHNALTDVTKGFNAEITDSFEKMGSSEDGRWTGKVVDNEDPDKLGRVKILVFGFYDELPKSALPWAVPDISYIGGTNGSFIIPEVGTFVRGYFDQGDIQKPIYDSVAFSMQTALNAVKNPSIMKFEDYPHKMVLMETDQGDYLTLNRADGETRFHHRTGLDITVGADGSLHINIGGKLNQQGNIKIECHGDTEIKTEGETKITSEMGNVTVDAKAGMVMLGNNQSKQFVNNIPVCPITGMPHFTGNKNVLC